MSQTRPRSRSSSSLRSWANNIPLVPLEHQPQDRTPSQKSDGPAFEPADIALPVSRQSLASAMKAEGSHPDHEDLSRNFAEAITGIDSSSLPGVSGNNDDNNASPAHTSISQLEVITAARLPVDVYSDLPVSSAESQEDEHVYNEALGAPTASSSLEQLQRSYPAAPFNVLLPDSASTLSYESTSINSFSKLQHLPLVVPSCVPLPESANSLSGTDMSDQYSTADPSIAPSHIARVRTHSSSLEQIQRLDPGCPVLPSSMPLPQSTQTLPEENMAVVAPRRTSYWHQVRRLQRTLPHLEDHVLANSRHLYAGKVACIDSLSSGTVVNLGRFDIKDEDDRSRLAETFADLKLECDKTITSRIILVEDLCPMLIEMLGDTFGLDPEFFAEHLNQSGYGTAHWNDPPPGRWKTGDMTKTYTSMAWCRPVYQVPKLTEWLQIPSDLLSKLKGSKENASRVKWRDADFTAQGERNTDAREHRLVLETNIFRQSWALSARPLGPDINLVPSAWQERVSVCICRSPNGVPIEIFLLDPLPTITDSQTLLYAQDHNRILYGLRRRNRQARSASSVAKDEVTIAFPMSTRIVPEIPCNKLEATARQRNNLWTSLNTIPSTFQVIRIGCLSATQHNNNDKIKDPVMMLLETVERDTRAFFQSLEWALDDISHDSLDDFLVTRRLTGWRKFMNEFEISIPAMGKQLDGFLHFVSRTRGESELPEEVGIVLQRIGDDVDRVERRLHDAYADLRADMQFAESRRSISETKTVTRLTELAFIFVPLSFCASLFSMSVRELGDGVSVWIYIITALTMVFLAYSVRFFLGSELLVNSTRRSLERLGVRPGDTSKPSMLTIVRFTLQDLWERAARTVMIMVAASLGLSAAFVVPIVFMWTSNNLGSSFKSMITLVLLSTPMTIIFHRLIGRYVWNRDRGWGSSEESEESDSGEDV